MLSKPTANCWSESNSASLHQTQGASDRWFATFREPTGVSIGLWTANPPTPAAGEL